MNLISLIQIARKEMNKSGLKDWNFYLSTVHVSNFGETNFGSKTICLNSKKLLSKLPQLMCIRILEEEIEHAVICTPCNDRELCTDMYKHCDKLKKQITKEEAKMFGEILKKLKSKGEI